MTTTSTTHQCKLIHLKDFVNLDPDTQNEGELALLFFNEGVLSFSSSTLGVGLGGMSGLLQRGLWSREEVSMRLVRGLHCEKKKEWWQDC